MSRWVSLAHADLFDYLPTLDADSIDSCVVDPPYGIGFMGREWDTFRAGVEQKQRVASRVSESDNPNLRGRQRAPASSPSAVEYNRSLRGQITFQDWTEAWARQILRVLKPGAHLVVCGAPRSQHRMVCGIENAGFEIRDMLMWVFGQGFPKSLDVSKAVDNTLTCGKSDPMSMWDGSRRVKSFDENGRRYLLPGAQTGASRKAGQEDLIHTAAERWRGFGTGLKPGWEPILLARKPLTQTVAANVMEYGTGAINIDVCRVGNASDQGRWPANVLHDSSDEVLAGFGDSGFAARFFYCAKASKRDREDGCEALPVKSAGEVTGGRAEDSAGLDSPRAGAGRTGGARNFHPTVKPTALMQWLVRLVTPKGGVVLDCFMGSGSTGRAAVLEQCAFLGVEREAEFVRIAKARIAAAKAKAVR